MDIKKALVKTQKKLKDINFIKNPRLEAEFLLSLTFKKERTYILSHQEEILNTEQTKSLELLIDQRLDGQPLAYLSGHKEFYGLEFAVNKHTLVPRPETELMVDLVLKLIKPNSKYLILDIGTGSGAISISLAKQTKNKNINFIASDISKHALSTAKKNAIKHKVTSKILFKLGNLLQPHLTTIKKLPESTGLIICANLPYLTPKGLENSPGIQKEPKQALLAGNDGLELYRELVVYIAKHNISATTFLEIDPSQTNKLKQVINNDLPESNINIIKDLSKRNRFIRITT